MPRRPPAGDVVGTCRDLLRIDTSNPGSTEEAAAAYVVDRLCAAGLDATVIEPAPGRCSVLSRQRGADPSLPPLVVHGHLDVVPPQDDAAWTHDPFGGEEADGFLWGRGAVDMKGTVAAMLTLQESLARDGQRPRRDVIFAYFADEEMGGVLGSVWIVEHRPELFAGAELAIGEVGGFTVHLPNGRRAYPVQIAERGLLWLRLTARGPQGHAAFTAAPGTVVQLADAVARIGRLTLAGDDGEIHRALLAGLGQLNGAAASEAELLDPLGSFGAMARAAAATRFTPTVVAGGAKVNVVPSEATALVDCRVVPGQLARARAAVADALDPGIECEELATSDGITAPLSAPLLAAAEAAVRRVDPEGVVVPFTMGGGSDAQRLARLGISGYGFTPVVLPPGFDYLGAFHAPDERIPVSGLVDGARMLAAFVRSY